MQLKTKVMFIASGIILLVFGACVNPALSEVDQYATCDVRVFPAPEHGYLRLSSEQVYAGGYVTIYANPEPGYVLTDIILQRESQKANPSMVNTPGPKFLQQIDSNTAITALFAPKDLLKQTISVDPSISNGLVFPEWLSEQPGANTRINIIPEPGYDIVDGSLKVIGYESRNPIPVSDALPYVFTLPTENVIIEAKFEQLNSDDLKGRASRYLSVGQYDIAATLYESAYQLNKSDPDLILYSALGLLGNILTDPNVRSLLATNSLGFSPVPDTLDDWVCDDVYWTGTDRWYTEYAATRWTPKDATLPRFYNRLDGFVTPFGDSRLMQQPGVGHIMIGDNRPTREKFRLFVFWALVSSYRNGFNPFIERVNRYVFGKQFEAATLRAATLPADAKVLLNPRLKERFHLENYYGSGDTYIGKPELEYIVGNLLAVKAIFEYLAVYDWTIEMRNWLVDNMGYDEGLEQILVKMFILSKSNVNHEKLWTDLSTVAKMLPLKNNFLQVRDRHAMDRALSNLTVALEKTNFAMDYWYNSSGITTGFTGIAQDNQRWVRQAWAQAKNALAGGNDGVFYFPRHFPSSISGSYWPDGTKNEYDGDDASKTYGNKVYGVKLERFFTPGAFTLTNLFTTELGGRALSLFKIAWYEDDEFNPVYLGDYNYEQVMSPIVDRGSEQNVGGSGYDASYGIYSFEINTKNLKEIFPKGFGDIGDENGGKALLNKVFPHISLWPWADTHFIGVNEAAGKVYEFYHKITAD